MNYKYFFSIYKTTRIKFNTNLSAEEIKERLDELIEARTFFPIFKAFTSNRDYMGKVSEQSFEFKKLLGFGRRGINPVVYGKINRVGDHAVVDVELIVDNFVIFYSLFLIVALFLTADFAFILVEAVVRIYRPPHVFQPEILILPFFWLLWIGGLFFQVDSYQSNLRTIIKDLELVFEVSSESVPHA